MKKYLLLIIILSIALCACANQTDTEYVVINNKTIKVEIADTQELQYQGLSDREELCADCGMLFVFGDKQVRTFVMRRMNFPLDMIWIEDNKIVKTNENAIPEGVDPVMRYSSEVPVSYVLEVNAGFCQENRIEVGDSVKFDLK